MKTMLTTLVACKLVGLDRQRFNEYVASGDYECAPRTVSGRTRLFDPDDMIGLAIFKDEMEGGVSPSKAGKIACLVAQAVRENPEARFICVRQHVVGSATAYPDTHSSAYSEFADGRTAHKITAFNIAALKERIAFETENERSIVGERDE